MKECHFLGWVIFRLISDIRPSICVETAKKRIWPRLPSSNCYIWWNIFDALAWKGVIPCKSAGLVVPLSSGINAHVYLITLSDQIHLLIPAMFTDVNAVSQNDNAQIYTANIAVEWQKEHFSDVDHLFWPPQSPELNIIAYLLCILETHLSSCYPPPSSLQEIETILTKEGWNVPVETTKTLYNTAHF